MIPASYARAALLVSASGLCFGVMSAVVRYVSGYLPLAEVVFFRNAMGLLVIVPWLIIGGRALLRTPNWRLHMLRSSFGVLSMFCLFYALAHLPLADATLLNFTAPLYIPLIAAWWLKEAAPRHIYRNILLGFIGIALILKPGSMTFDHSALIAAAAGVFTALAFVSLRRMADSEPALRTVFYFGLIGAVMSAVPMTFVWTTPPPALWPWLVALGITASAGQWLLTSGYRYAPAAVVGPFTYTTVLFAAALGWIFWAEAPDELSFLGMILVIIASSLVLQRTGVQAK